MKCLWIHKDEMETIKTNDNYEISDGLVYASPEDFIEQIKGGAAPNPKDWYQFFTLQD